MPDVFINYRSGDGERTAALIDQELSRRFGRDRIFRASKSIPPGHTYPEDLLTNLRRCTVLLAVIGRDWTDFSGLRNPTDWVRREIVEAFDCGLTVIPVLDGRKTDRLGKTSLPDELAHLTDLQSIVLDTHDTEAGLKRLGDLMVEMVPGFHDLDRDAAEQQNMPDTVRNSADGVGGGAVQGRDITGDVGNTVIKASRGPIHTGTGNIYQNSHHDSRTRNYSGAQHYSGDGMTNINGDMHGDIQHRFGKADGCEDDDR